MDTNIDIHPIQATILCQLLFMKSVRFSEMDRQGLTTDHFSFHLRQLINWKMIEKDEDRKYSLTGKGKEFANRFDTEIKEVERQPKIGVLVIAKKADKYLIQQRLKQPYYGFWGFITGKMRWGETVEETALRELEEETGLTGRAKLVAVKHKMDYDQQGQLLEDKFFMAVKVDKVRGKLKEEVVGGKNCWMIREEIIKISDLFDGVEETINFANESSLKFSEMKYKVKRY